MAAEDSAAVAGLWDQLGYPAAPAQILERFTRIECQTGTALFVAEVDSRVVGWIHVVIVPVFEVDLCTEIAGLVVDADYRSRGIGGLLLEAAEQWARKNGCRLMRVRSRVTRERAHAFYERCGFVRIKTQHAFEKRWS